MARNVDDVGLGPSAAGRTRTFRPVRERVSEGGWGTALAVASFGVVAALAWLVVAWAAGHPPTSRPPEAVVAGVDNLSPWVRGWSHWDAGWYDAISRDGYSYQAGSQSSVAFFPVYPLAIRLAQVIVPDWSSFARGSAITLVSGLVAAGLLFRWCRRWLSASGAWTAVALVAVYPYSFYLFGAVYADALFLVIVLIAFVLLERRQVGWAIVAAALCSAARPAGLIVVVALAWRHWELGRREGSHSSGWVRPALPSLAFGALGAMGFVGYCVYLHQRFGDAFAFASTQSAAGWDQGPGPHTWFKVAFFDEVVRSPLGPGALGLTLQFSFALTMLATVPRVRRRFSASYAGLVTMLVLLPLVASKDFQGTGRYLLPAFPVFAVWGELLATRTRARPVVLGVGLVGVLLFASWFAKGNYLA